MELKLHLTGEKILRDFGNYQSNLYKPGMGLELNVLTTERMVLLKEKCGRWNASFNPDFTFLVHLYGIQVLSGLLQKEQADWDNKHNPVTLLQGEEIQTIFLRDPLSYFLSYDL